MGHFTHFYYAEVRRVDAEFYRETIIFESWNFGILE